MGRLNEVEYRQRSEQAVRTWKELVEGHGGVEPRGVVAEMQRRSQLSKDTCSKLAAAERAKAGPPASPAPEPAKAPNPPAPEPFKLKEERKSPDAPAEVVPVVVDEEPVAVRRRVVVT